MAIVLFHSRVIWGGGNYRVRVKFFGGRNLVALEEGGEFGSYPENFANIMESV